MAFLQHDVHWHIFNRSFNILFKVKNKIPSVSFENEAHVILRSVRKVVSTDKEWCMSQVWWFAAIISTAWEGDVGRISV
jgi:hypothetical protein